MELPFRAVPTNTAVNPIYPSYRGCLRKAPAIPLDRWGLQAWCGHVVSEPAVQGVKLVNYLNSMRWNAPIPWETSG